MPLAEVSIRSCSKNLTHTDDIWVATISTTTGLCLSLQVFSFAARIVAKPIKKLESIAMTEIKVYRKRMPFGLGLQIQRCA